MEFHYHQYILQVHPFRVFFGFILGIIVAVFELPEGVVPLSNEPITVRAIGHSLGIILGPIEDCNQGFRDRTRNTAGRVIGPWTDRRSKFQASGGALYGKRFYEWPR
jgi:hypothetical protein